MLERSLRPHPCHVQGNMYKPYLASPKEAYKDLQDIIQSGDAGALEVLQKLYKS